MNLRLFAINVRTVRSWFGAAPEMAAGLRHVASERFRADVMAPRAPGLLGRLGPLFGRDPWAPVVAVDHPGLADVEALVTGRFVAPDRLLAAWRVVEAWLDAESAAQGEVSASGAEWERTEMALATAGLPSSKALRHLWSDDLSVPLREAPGLEAGWCPHERVRELPRRLSALRAHLDPDTVLLLDAVEPVLSTAADAGLDVVGLARP